MSFAAWLPLLAAVAVHSADADYAYKTDYLTVPVSANVVSRTAQRPLSSNFADIFYGSSIGKK
jgi:hypothetical protein